MSRADSLPRPSRDESGMSLVELMVAVTLMIVVITVGFIVTTTVVKVTYTTQRNGSLTGPAQNGMDTIQGFFSGAVPNQTVTTPVGVPGATAPLYTNQCSASALTSTATDVWLCSVRSGSTTAYSYELHFPASTCTSNGVCALQIVQQGVSQPVVQIASVCVTCANTTNTSFGFSPVPADLSKVSSVTITLTLASPTNGTSNPASTTTLVRQVSLSNSLGGTL